MKIHSTGPAWPVRVWWCNHWAVSWVHHKPSTGVNCVCAPNYFRAWVVNTYTYSFIQKTDRSLADLQLVLVTRRVQLIKWIVVYKSSSGTFSTAQNTYINGWVQGRSEPTTLGTGSSAPWLGRRGATPTRLIFCIIFWKINVIYANIRTY